MAADRLAVTCAAPMACLATETWLRFLVWLVVGMAIHLLCGRTHSRLARGGTDAEVAARRGAGRAG